MLKRIHIPYTYIYICIFCSHLAQTTCLPLGLSGEPKAAKDIGYGYQGPQAIGQSFLSWRPGPRSQRLGRAEAPRLSVGWQWIPSFQEIRPGGYWSSCKAHGAIDNSAEDVQHRLSFTSQSQASLDNVASQAPHLQRMQQCVQGGQQCSRPVEIDVSPHI